MELNTELEPERLTDREDTKTLPCRSCGRPCIVTKFATPAKTECTTCANKAPEFNLNLDEEVLTDKDETKKLPCRQCGRSCVVTIFATQAKVLCLTCQKHKQELVHVESMKRVQVRMEARKQRDEKKAEIKEKVRIQAAHTVDPSKLEHLADGLINTAFRTTPLCPFNPEHDVELKSISHAPQYGPRHLLGYNAKGIPTYDQRTGESAMYQCNECLTVISFSTMHQVQLMAQNETRELNNAPASLALIQGVRVA